MLPVVTLELREGSGLWLHCPGCGCAHLFKLTRQGDLFIETAFSWSFNGDMEQPTCTPSLRCRGTETCHLWLKKGKIIYLGDCTHKYAGKSLETEWGKV